MSKKLKKVHFHYQFSATYRQETRKGREFLVVPGIIIQEQVLNYYFVPGDEIGLFFQAWNDKPITIRHPKTENGSAGWIDVGDELLQVIGRIYNARFDPSTTKLHAEFWFELAELRASEDGKEIERRIMNGETIEVSTGYWANEEMTEGVWDDVPYYAIHHDLRPDHVAVLVDQIGACSVEDGCGIPRLNCAQCESDQVLVTNFKQPKKKGFQIMAIFGKKKKKAPAPAPVKVKITDPTFLAVLTALNATAVLVPGSTDEYMVTNAVTEPVVEEQPEADEGEPQRDPFAQELEAALEPIGGAEGFATLLVDLQGVVSAHKTESQNEEARKSKLIEKLTKNKKFPLTAETLQKLSLVEVQALVSTNLDAQDDFGALGAADLVALNAGGEDEDGDDEPDEDEVKANAASKVRKQRGIGLAGTLGQTIDVSVNNRRHRVGGVG